MNKPKIESASKLKIFVVYLGALLTGLALIIYPALGPILTGTGPDGFDFSSNQFGNLFIPQTLFAIGAALIAPFLSKYIHLNKILVWGCLALFLSMLILFFSHYLTAEKSTAWMLLMTGTSLLGIGFGMVITALNPIAFSLFPNNQVAAVAALHFFLGLGTAGSPLLLSLAQKTGTWYNLPLLFAIGLIILGVLILLLKQDQQATLDSPEKLKVPNGLWLFVVLITLYGICEGTLGSYGSVFLKAQGLSIVEASQGLALFWGGLTLGRVMFSIISIRLNLNWFYMGSLIIVGIILFSIPSFTGAFTNLSAMGVAGFFMSSIFPRSVSWATETFKDHAVLASGFMVASLQLGTGIGTNFVGILSKTVSFAVLFKVIAAVAILALIFIFITKNKYKLN